VRQNRSTDLPGLPTVVRFLQHALPAPGVARPPVDGEQIAAGEFGHVELLGPPVRLVLGTDAIDPFQVFPLSEETTSAGWSFLLSSSRV